MITALLVLHLLVTLTLIAVVLIQRSEGGGLGIGSSQGMGSFMSGRGTANLLTRTTGILAAAFMALSLALAVLNRGSSGHTHDILALPAETAPSGAVPGGVIPGSNLPARPPAAPAPAPAPAPVPGH
jgi:preprotein translocase subunit SecG